MLPMKLCVENKNNLPMKLYKNNFSYEMLPVKLYKNYL